MQMKLRKFFSVTDLSSSLKKAAIVSGEILNADFRRLSPNHKGRDLPLGTLRNIMTTADIPDSEWKIKIE
jgi:hypothetical protein